MMNNNEAIAFIKRAVIESEKALESLQRIKSEAQRVKEVGEYYANLEHCVKEIEACRVAITALEDIQEYRVAKEQGRLLMLPCNVGDTVYIVGMFGCSEIEEWEITKITMRWGENDEPYFYADLKRAKGNNCSFWMSEFGKSVFVTKAEAEQALFKRNGTKKIKYGKYTITQAPNHHVMISENGEMISHIPCSKALSEAKLIELLHDVLKMRDDAMQIYLQGKNIIPYGTKIIYHGDEYGWRNVKCYCGHYNAEDDTYNIYNGWDLCHVPKECIEIFNW